MSNRCNAIRNEQLGMSAGKAVHMLRKKIMFNLIQRLNEDTCFKCGKIIQTVDELSIEHKIPWLYGDISLFWDLDNIAFSHLRCNKPDRPAKSMLGREPTNKLNRPEGMNWCFKHKEFLPIDQFSKNTSSHTGLHNLCKDHQHYNRSC
jgi:hypothetical protein